MMLAKPGSGKSHFIKCLAENMKRFVSPVMFNMATLERTEELLQPLDAARNFKALDKLPLLFLDEFDSDPNKYPLLLPLLWDGELRIGHRELKLGRIVIVIAASGSAMNATMKRAKTMEEITGVKSKERKTIDLFSRINGGILEIPDLDPDRTVDKICLTISLLRHRFGSQLESAPWALLRFVALSRFRYGVRSITHLIDEIPAKGEVKRLTLADVLLPLSTKRDLQESGLAYHLISQRGAKEIVELWQDCAACESLVKFYTPQVEDDYL
jgi:hypothetical protein